MSLIDVKNMLTEETGDTLLPASSGTASTNVIDCGTTKANLNAFVNIIVTTALIGACSVVVQDSADNTTFAAVDGGTVELSGTAKGSIFTVRLPKNTKRFIRCAVTYSAKPTAGKYVAYVGPEESDH